MTTFIGRAISIELSAKGIRKMIKEHGRNDRVSIFIDGVRYVWNRGDRFVLAWIRR